MKGLEQYIIESDNSSDAEKLMGTLMYSVVEIWKAHLYSNKYAKHMALDEYYKEMPEKVDSFIEAYIGLHQKPTNLVNDKTLESFGGDAIRYLQDLHKRIEAHYEEFENSESKSALDDILELIDSTLYKLKELE